MSDNTAPLDIFVELANAQGPAYARGDELPWTAARPQDFAGASMFLLGRDNTQYFEAGTKIKTPFDGKISSTNFGPKRSADDHKTASGGSIQFLETDWTEYEWVQEVSWHEINLQGGGEILSSENSQRFWRILDKKDRDFAIDPIKGFERDVYAPPSAEMFDTAGTGVAPLKSIHVGCNVWESKHYADGNNHDGLFPFMVNQQGLLPANYRREDSYGREYSSDASMLSATKVQYKASTAGTADTQGKHLLDQFQYALDLGRWKPTPLAGKWDDALEVYPSVISCTREAKRLFNQTNRAHNNFFATINPLGDPSQEAPAFGGIPLLVNDSLRDSEVYPDTNGGADPSGAAARYLALGKGVSERDESGAAGGYYYFYDPRAVNIWFHRNRPWQSGDWRSMWPLNDDVMKRIGKMLGNIHFEHYIPNCILLPDGNVPEYA